MHPILFKIGPFTLYTYGFFIALAFICGLMWACREARLVGEEPERITDLGFYIIIAAIVGSRLLFVLVNLKEYLKEPINILKFWEGGLVFYGGLIAGVLVGLFYLKKHHLDTWKYADILAPPLALGQAIGRIGCLMAGCCYGMETDLPWAIIFTDPNTLAVRSVHLHPTQIYYSITGLVIFFFLVGFRRRKSYDGQLFWISIALYSPLRFIIDFFRGDEVRNLFFQTISLSQAISLLLFFTAIYMLWRLRIRKAAGGKV